MDSRHGARLTTENTGNLWGNEEARYGHHTCGLESVSASQRLDGADIPTELLQCNECPLRNRPASPGVIRPSFLDRRLWTGSEHPVLAIRKLGATNKRGSASHVNVPEQRQSPVYCHADEPDEGRAATADRKGWTYA